MRRDFTYVDDIVEAMARLVPLAPTGDPRWNGDAPDPATSRAPYRIFNIGNNNPVELMTLVATIEDALGRTAVKEYAPMQVGDVPATYADVSDLTAAVDFQPSTPITVGVQRFVDWFTHYRLRNASGADPAALESGSTKDGKPEKSGPIAETDRQAYRTAPAGDPPLPAHARTIAVIGLGYVGPARGRRLRASGFRRSASISTKSASRSCARAGPDA